MINREDAHQFLSALHGERLPDDSWLVISWTEPEGLKSRWESDLSTALDIAMGKATTFNVYYGINLRDAKAEQDGKRGSMRSRGLILRISDFMTYGIVPQAIWP
jgi:hypothetical protein